MNISCELACDKEKDFEHSLHKNTEDFIDYFETFLISNLYTDSFNSDSRLISCITQGLQKILSETYQGLDIEKISKDMVIPDYIVSKLKKGSGLRDQLDRINNEYDQSNQEILSYGERYKNRYKEVLDDIHSQLKDGEKITYVHENTAVMKTEMKNIADMLWFLNELLKLVDKNDK